MNRLIWLAATAATLSSAGSIMTEPVKSPPIVPARDGNIAIEEELCSARKGGSVAAYNLFIARHPDHPLTPVAVKERESLKLRKTSP